MCLEATTVNSKNADVSSSPESSLFSSPVTRLPSHPPNRFLPPATVECVICPWVSYNCDCTDIFFYILLIWRGIIVSRTHPAPPDTASIWPADLTKRRCWSEQQECRRCWRECGVAQTVRKTAWRLFTKLSIRWPYNPAIGLLHVYPKEMKTYVLAKPVHGCSQQL